MDNISAVIITFNEEKKIAACLESLQGVADEIIVMDSFSTDETATICKRFGVKFYQQRWNGYGAQKNEAAAKAVYDYVLSLDADERLSPLLRQSLLEAKMHGLSGVYQMNRLNNFYGCDLHHGNVYPDRMKRLYNRREIAWSERPVHETLELPAGTTVQLLRGDLLHRSKDTIEEHVAGINKYSGMSADLYFQAGKKGAWFKMIAGPVFAFVKGFFFRLGFLDGYAGYIMARINAQEVFLKYSKLLLLQKQNPNKRS